MRAASAPLPPCAARLREQVADDARGQQVVDVDQELLLDDLVVRHQEHGGDTLGGRRGPGEGEEGEEQWWEALHASAAMV